MLPFWIQKHKTVWPNGITRFYLKGKQQFFTLCCENLLCRDTCEGGMSQSDRGVPSATSK